MKEIKSKNDFATWYVDGSLDAKCHVCGKEDKLKEDAKIALVAHTMDSWNGSDYKCLDCWKAKKNIKIESTQDRIAYAQSWNLAVALWSPTFATKEWISAQENIEEDRKMYLEAWQKYFHKKLTNGKD